HDGHTAAHGDFLRAQDLLDRLRPPRAGLHRRVIRDDHDFAPVHNADARDDAGRGRLAVVLVIRDEQSDLDEARAGVRETGDALACRQFPLRVLALDLVRPTAGFESRFERSDLVAELTEATGHT